MYFLGGLLLVGLGQLMVWKPRLFYELTERWKNRDAGAPSRLYLFSTRFGGVLSILLGLAGVISFFVL